MDLNQAKVGEELKVDLKTFKNNEVNLCYHCGRRLTYFEFTEDKHWQSYKIYYKMD